MSEEKDPWASLADSLGASPNRETSPPPPQRPVEKPRQEPRPAAPRTAAPRSPQGWDELDSSLGLPPTRESGRPAERRPAAPRPPAEARLPTEAPPSREPRAVDRPATPPRREFDFDDEPRRSERSERSERTERTERADGGDRGDAIDANRRREAGEPRGEGTEQDGEGRPRRRRGRRGGRGRGRGRRDREATSAPARLGDEPAPRDVDLDSEPLDDLVDHRPAAAGETLERPLDEEGRPRRRRRRRGRRGGRRAGAAGEPSGEPTARRESGDDVDDEPLPAGYGRAQTARQPEAREPGSRAADGERRGRRRRRGRGDDAARRPAADAGGESGQRRGRRSRRGADRDRDRDRTSSSSSLARRSRDDFAPVSRGYDEDDEGLEFLGVEEAVQDQPRREQRHAEDDVIAESGLDAVRDVPSWVEAIGIVIAGNLDARSRPRSDRGDDDRRRR